MVPASGKHAEQCCGRALLPQLVHAGRCRAAEQQVRCHNGCRHALAQALRRAGLVAAQEVAVPGWTRKEGDKLVDAVLDVETYVPGSTVAIRIDIEIVRTEAKSRVAQPICELLYDEGQRKIQRYSNEVAPLVFAQRGRWGVHALATLHMLASICAPLAHQGHSQAIRSIARAVAPASAVSESRAKLGVLGGAQSAQ